MVTRVEAATCVVVMVNGVELAPVATVTDDGTDTTAGLELARATSAPPAGAAPFRYTRFEKLDAPPAIGFSSRPTEETTSGFTVRVAVLVTPP